MKIIPVILSGGEGSRLWPVSREEHPKPFIRLEDGISLLQHTWLRAANIEGVEDIITVTNRELFFKTEDDYVELNTTGHRDITNRYILEPNRANTAAAIITAALHIAQTEGDDTLLLVLPADHIISNQIAFTAAVNQACKMAENGKLVTFGIKPERPETAYGYIETQGNEVLGFIEKPNLEKAIAYCSSDNFFWNSGMFCFSANSIIEEMSHYALDIVSATRTCLQQSKQIHGEGFTQLNLDRKTFANIATDSIDYAVMEKSRNIAVIPCDIGWCDIGSWNGLSALSSRDHNGNSCKGEIVLHEVTNCHIQSEDRLVAMTGVSDLIVVDTDDALLIANRDGSQNVKHLYTRLKDQNHPVYKSHNKVKRPWGTYSVLDKFDGVKIKRIEVNPGCHISLQMHHKRCEHWIVVKGKASVTNEERNFTVNSNESTYIKAGHIHQLENKETTPLIIIEVQTGDYLEEDDIIRFE